MILFIIVPAQA